MRVRHLTHGTRARFGATGLTAIAALALAATSTYASIGSAHAATRPLTVSAASGTSGSSAPSGSAESAGITAPGDAYMGWSQHTATARAAQAAAARVEAAQQQQMRVNAATQAQAERAGTASTQNSVRAGTTQTPKSATKPTTPTKPTAPKPKVYTLTTMASVPPPPKRPPLSSPTLHPQGIDVARYEGVVNWKWHWAAGRRFAFIKATEGTSYTSPTFGAQYNGSFDVGMVRGAYHFATPNNSPGYAQADWFVAHGGGWSADGRTLPGTLDIEYNPYGSTCYGMSNAQMTSWIASFVTEYHKKTTRWPIIYSTNDWWNRCTGNTTAFSANDPLWLARYNTSPGTLPGAWNFYTFWQYTDSPIDTDVFNGTADRLVALARG